MRMEWLCFGIGGGAGEVVGGAMGVARHGGSGSAIQAAAWGVAIGLLVGASLGWLAAWAAGYRPAPARVSGALLGATAGLVVGPVSYSLPAVWASLLVGLLIGGSVAFALCASCREFHRGRTT
jgi:hypothetical protein